MFLSLRKYLINMDSFEIRNQNLIKIFRNAFPNSLEYLGFSVDPENIEINGTDSAKSFFCQLILNKNAFFNYSVTNSHFIPIINKQFNTIFKSPALKILASPVMKIGFEDVNVTINIADKNKTSELNIKKQLRGVKIIKTETFGVPNISKFKNAAFCIVSNPEYLRSVYNFFQDIDFIEISIEDFSVTFRGIDKLEGNSEVRIEGRINSSAKSGIFATHCRNASNVGDIETIKQSKISISKEGIVMFSHILEDDIGFLNYYISKINE